MSDFDVDVWRNDMNDDITDIDRSFIYNECYCVAPDPKVKSRCWWFIIYPEHYKSYKHMIFKFMSLGVPFVLSPLHDKDKFPGELEDRYKKPHYHLLLCYSGPKTSNQVFNDLINSGIEWGFGAGCNTIIVDNIVNDKIGAIKYLIHSGWDNKYQYSSDDMLFFNEDKQLILLNTYSDTEAFQIITDIIDKYKFVEYLDLIHFLEKNNTTLLLYTIKKLGAPVTAYLKSLKRVQDKYFYDSHVISEDLH